MDQQDASDPAGRGEPDGPLSVSDEELPEDLRPSEDNPLALPADDDVPDDVLTEGVGPGGSHGGSEDAAQGGGGGSDTSSVEASSEAAEADGDDTGRG